MKEIYDMKGTGSSIRRVADDLGIARNTVRRYLNSLEALLPKPLPQRASKLDPYTEYVDCWMSEGLENCVVLHRELKAPSGPGLPDAGRGLQGGSRVSKKGSLLERGAHQEKGPNH